VRFKCIALRVTSSGTWSLSLLRIACYFWVFPDTLDGLEQWWCWAHDWRLFRVSLSDCERFLSLPRGSLWISYSSRARGLKDPYLVSGCAAPTEGLTLDSQLACDPSSGCIATIRTSLPESKWTSVKNLVSSLPRISLVIAHCDWFFEYIACLHRRYKNQVACSLLSCSSPRIAWLVYLLSHRRK
jgi:hypothetical protein